jgi:hypothetical protein
LRIHASPAVAAQLTEPPAGTTDMQKVLIALAILAALAGFALRVFRVAGR